MEAGVDVEDADLMPTAASAARTDVAHDLDGVDGEREGDREGLWEGVEAMCMFGIRVRHEKNVSEMPFHTANARVLEVFVGCFVPLTSKL